MEQRKYNVTLQGLPWLGPESNEGDKLAMLAALIEHCGAAAAVRIGDLAVWREAVRVVDMEQRAAFVATSEPVMGRDILAAMPFNDDPTLGEISPTLPPNPHLPPLFDAARKRRLGGDDDSTD